ncbi:DUF3995 domain-containing protein [Solitalea sp. MAHUQ-68]|uniref:DUF3995 domain-containing protein n=1 Tax=Solitalea agri TaxID=2953739 RepID=A0A9X2F1Q2_9SPHI|nr:DUF3995 domain-containing protein [Solitalea agri]MCO4293037.1 DUF3995 domain-containing protein [Solitalea agri]
MVTIISFFLFFIFLFLAGMHFYWGVGGRWAVDAVVPTKGSNVKVFNPKLLECFIVGSVLLAIGLFILTENGLIRFNLPNGFSKYGLWFIATIFFLRAIGEFRYVGFFKRIKHTKFGRYDTRFYSPLCLLIGILTVIIALEA